MERTGNNGSVKKSKKRKHSSTTEAKHSQCQKLVEPNRTENVVVTPSTNSGNGRTKSNEVNMERTGNDGSVKKSKKTKDSSTTLYLRKDSSTKQAKNTKYQKMSEPNETASDSACPSTSSGKDNKERTKLKQKSGNEMPPLVYFDLETTGLYPETDSITQIAALSEEKSFDVYVKPTCRIGQWARENTHLIFDTEKGQMYYRNKKIDSKKPAEALRDFLSYLREYEEPVILVAHNCHDFDANFLLDKLKKYDLWDEFVDLIKGFADTLPMFQKVHPGMRNHKLPTLASKFLDDKSQAMHNAIDDANILKTLVENKGNINYLVENCLRSCSEIRSTMGWF